MSSASNPFGRPTPAPRLSPAPFLREAVGWLCLRRRTRSDLVGVAAAAAGVIVTIWAHVTNRFAVEAFLLALIAVTICAYAFRHRSEWRQRKVRDGLMTIVAAVAMFAAAYAVGLPHTLFKFAVDHADYHADKIMFGLMIVGIVPVFYVRRRLQDLHLEIAARRRAEDDAQMLARRDPLTGLPNRRSFDEELDEALRGIGREHCRAAVLMLDLDGFKAINDRYGHCAGDEALIELSSRIVKSAPDAVVARVGGDEFAIVLPRVGSLAKPAALAKRITAAIAEPLHVAGREAALGVGIGIAIAPDDAADASEILRCADLALYRAKAQGKSSTCFFDAATDDLDPVPGLRKTEGAPCAAGATNTLPCTLP